MRLLLGLPFLIALVLFAVSNRQPVAFGFWPTDLALVVPLSGAVLAVAAAAFLVGASIVWLTELRVRRRARRAELRVEALQDEVRALQAQISPPPRPPLSLG